MKQKYQFNAILHLNQTFTSGNLVFPYMVVTPHEGTSQRCKGMLGLFAIGHTKTLTG